MSEPDPVREKSSPTPTPSGLQTWPVWISLPHIFKQVVEKTGYSIYTIGIEA